MEQEPITQPNADTQPTPAASAAAVYKPRLFSVLDKTWEVAKNKIWALLGVDLMILVTIAVGIIVVGVPATILVAITFLIKIPALTVFVGALGILAIIAMFIKVTLWGFISSVKILQSEESITVRQALSESRPLIYKFFWTYLMAMLVILGGYLLFIVPGIIASVATAFVLLVAINENKTGMDALARSRELVRGRWWSVALTFLGFTVVVLAIMLMTGSSGASPLMIIVTPIAYILMYVLYRQLSDNPTNKPATNPWFYKLFMVVAVIGIVAGIIGASAAAGTDWDKFTKVFESSMQSEYEKDGFDWDDTDFENDSYQDWNFSE